MRALIIALAGLCACNGFHTSAVVRWTSAHGRVSRVRVAASAADAAGTVAIALPKPLGLVLEEVADTAGAPFVLVAEVVDGGSAASSGAIRTGMRLLSVNDVATLELEPAMSLIVAAEGDVRLVLTSDAPAARQTAAVAPPLTPPPPPPPPRAAPAPPPPAPAPPRGPATVSVTVQQSGKPDTRLPMPQGAILRTELLKAKVDVYTMVGKMTNCGGAGQCGTCVVDISGGGCSPRTAVEEAKLKGKPASYRLACQTVLTGDTTVATKPK